MRKIGLLALITVLLLPAASAACLTNTQINTIDTIENQTGIGDGQLQSIFEAQCDKRQSAIDDVDEDLNDDLTDYKDDMNQTRDQFRSRLESQIRQQLDHQDELAQALNNVAQATNISQDVDQRITEGDKKDRERIKELENKVNELQSQLQQKYVTENQMEGELDSTQSTLTARMTQSSSSGLFSGLSSTDMLFITLIVGAVGIGLKRKGLPGGDQDLKTYLMDVAGFDQERSSGNVPQASSEQIQRMKEELSDPEGQERSVEEQLQEDHDVPQSLIDDLDEEQKMQMLQTQKDKAQDQDEDGGD